LSSYNKITGDYLDASRSRLEKLFADGGDIPPGISSEVQIRDCIKVDLERGQLHQFKVRPEITSLLYWRSGCDLEVIKQVIKCVAHMNRLIFCSYETTLAKKRQVVTSVLAASETHTLLGQSLQGKSQEASKQSLEMGTQTFEETATQTMGIDPLYESLRDHALHILSRSSPESSAYYRLIFENQGEC